MNQRKWIFIFIVLALVAVAGGFGFYGKFQTTEVIEPVPTTDASGAPLETHPSLENNQ